MILTTNKSTILHCQQVYSSNSRSTFPPLNTRHEGLSCSRRLKQGRRGNPTSHLRALILLDHSLLSQFPISIHNTDTAPCQGRSNIRHCRSHSRIKHPTNQHRTWQLSMHDPNTAMSKWKQEPRRSSPPPLICSPQKSSFSFC